MKKGGLLSFNNNNINQLFWLHLFLKKKIIFSENCFLYKQKMPRQVAWHFYAFLSKKNFFLYFPILYLAVVTTCPLLYTSYHISFFELVSKAA